MSKLKTFINHINEAEGFDRLKQLGLTPNDTPEETVEALEQAFHSDERIKTLITELDSRVGTLFEPILARADEEAEEWAEIRDDMSWHWAEDISNYYVYEAIGDFGQVFESAENPERDSRLDRLRGLGLAPKKEFDERWEEMVDEWATDPAISAAIDTLRAKTNQIINKHIDLEDSQDLENWEQRQEWMFQSDLDDLGWLEYMIATDNLY